MASPVRDTERSTLPALFQESYARNAASIVCSARRGGTWTAMTYAELAEAVEVFARGLHVLGIRKGDRVAIALPNGPEWTIADHALLHLGAASVPLHTTSPASESAFVLKDSGAVAILADAPRWAPLSGKRDEFRELKHVVTMDAVEETTSWRGVAAKGRASKSSALPLFETLWRSVSATDLATLVYTSGTTGLPKGVMLTHANLVANVRAAEEALSVDGSCSALSILPLSHLFERFVEHTGAATGGRVFYPESMEAGAVREALVEAKPSHFVGVPRLFEKVATAVEAEASRLSGAKRRLYDRALRAGERSAERERRGGRPTLEARILRRLVFKRLRERMGGRIRFLVSGGAPLSPKVARFFWAAGIPVFEGYGLTEAGPLLSVNRPGNTKLGTVGKAALGVEIRIDEDGEVLARGPGVMTGYWKREKETAEALTSDGWLRTGDVGALDPEGFLSITDRKKELIVKSNGKKVAPAPIEKRLESSPFVLQAVCVGDDKPYVGALLVPNAEGLSKALARTATVAEWARDPEAARLIERAVDDVNRELGRHEAVKVWRLLPRELSVEAGDLTPSLKVKRRVLARTFEKELAEIYANLATRASEGSADARAAEPPS